jgi:3',5'-nucleoside bisphosphate phosphatase
LETLLPADLHVHTIASDSTLTPREVVAECAVHGVDTVAVTDHDTVDGVAETAAAGREVGVRVVPGVEMTSYVDGREIHILGLFIDMQNDAFRDLARRACVARHERVHKMVDLLQQHNINITADDVMAAAGPGVPGRPHVAQAMVKHGGVSSVSQAFKYYIANDGPAYVPKYDVSPAEVAGVIHGAGGVSVVSHPGVGLADLLVRQLIADGVQGIEAFHPMHSRAQVEHYLAMARELGALVSGGSDSHGGMRDVTRIGSILLDDEYVETLEARANQN